jgi:Mg-chelatase subunit ChlD
MSELEFFARSLAEDGVQFEKKPRRPPANPLIAVAAVTILGAAVLRSGPRSANLGAGAVGGPMHVAVVHGKEVIGNNVLVLLDNSGSMGGTNAQVQAQLNRLRVSGMSIENLVTIPGFSISLADTYAFLGILGTRIAANPSVDTVYVISDFSAGDEQANTPAAYRQLTKMVRDRQLRIYWSTVRDRPPPTYYDIARQSGGDVVPIE